MTEIRNILRIINDPDKNPVEFKLELERVLNRLMEHIDEIQGLRGEAKFYSDINLQDNKINFNDEGYLRIEDLEKRLQYYDKTNEVWRIIEGADLLDRLTSQVGDNSTLVLTDDGTDQTLTGNTGDITIVPAGGDVSITGNLSATGDISLDSTTVTDVTGSRAIGTIYQAGTSSPRIVMVSFQVT